ncbi:MAG: glycosyltransferase family 4 protein, partial [Thermodesulfobacteriaceae bacterium]|nr:glycosyltransferase family 4 protein [Thermodesulfobacteriaceae bacterium]
FIYRVVTKRANAVITVSEFSKAEILKYFPELENKIYVIYNGVNHNKFRPLDLPRKKQILFIGAIAKHKNISVILEAFLKVISKIPHKLVIVGSKDSGMPSDENITRILSMIPPNRIEFTGKVSDDDVVNLYNTSDLFIFPSIYEGFGLPLLEAMACGCPIIASKASSIPEVCGDSAIYFDPYSSEELATRILEMANNEAMKKDVIQKGIRRAKEFSWRKAAEMHTEVFKKVLYEKSDTKS